MLAVLPETRSHRQGLNSSGRASQGEKTGAERERGHGGVKRKRKKKKNKKTEELRMQTHREKAEEMEGSFIVQK